MLYSSVMLCYITCVMLGYVVYKIKYVDIKYVMLYNICSITCVMFCYLT